MVMIAGKERASKTMQFSDYYDVLGLMTQMADGEKVVFKSNSQSTLALVNSVIEPSLTREEMNGLSKAERKTFNELFLEASEQFKDAGITEEKKTG